MLQTGQMVMLGAVLALSAGCRLPGRDGPVSQSLAESRNLSRQGVAAMERGQQQQAESLLAKAVKVCPSDPEARRNYAETLWLHGSRNKAIEQMEEVARNGGEDAAFCTRLAEMYLAAGRTDAAARSVQQALDLDPKLASAWAVRGGVMRASGQPRQALADYLRALGYDPGDRKILIEAAELYRQLDEPERALQTLEVLADSYAPGEEPQQVLYLTGLAYTALGRHGDAVDSFSAALMRDKPTPEILFRLGEAELLAGHADEAANAVQQALALDPQHQPSRELISRIELARRSQEQGKITR
ncbi:MAG: tetratricopeptide repeat protein [Thermoguttaceae bacterium]